MKINLTMNPAMLQGVLTSKLNKYYDEYKEFVCKKDLPKFKVKPFNCSKTKSSVEAYISFENKSYIFNIEQHLFMIKPETIKALTFHEFTHILDESTFLQNLSYEERKTKLHFYTEYHAMQLEMMCACNFDYFSKSIKLNKDVIIYEGNNPKQITGYLQYIQKDYIATIQEKVSIKCNPRDALKIILHSIYLQSQIDFFFKCSDFDISEYINTNICISICGEDFKILCNTYNNEIMDECSYFENQNKLMMKIGLFIHEESQKIMDIVFPE